MNAGRLEQIGTPRELYRQPVSRFVADFLGEVNWIDGVGVRPEAVRMSKEAAPPGVRFIQGLVQNIGFSGQSCSSACAIR